MSGSLTPEYLKELAAGYAVGDLNPEEAAEFQRLLAEKPELLTEVNDLEGVLTQVLYGLNEVEPPHHLRSAILQATEIPANSTKSKPFPLQWSKIVGSVAALLLLIIGFDNYRLRQDLHLAKSINTLLESSQTRFFSLKGLDAANTAEGRVVMNPEQQKIVIFIRNLPDPPQGRVYRLWALVDKETIPCGLLRASPQGLVLDKLAIPSDLYTEVSGLILTLEGSPTTSDPVGPVVMKSMV